MKIISIVIIILFPFLATAHGLEPELGVDPGILPGERKYFFEKIEEWLSVNVFTISTRAKQAKKLEMASKRIAELQALLLKKDVVPNNLQEAVKRYKLFLRDAEDMAEKIIILDGKEIALAENFEKASRLHENVFLELLETADEKTSPIIYDALGESRIQNKKIFTFMVKNYQGTDADIEKHQRIVEQHAAIVQSRLSNEKVPLKLSELKFFLTEADKFRKAGLNIEAYELVEKAKNIIY